jgi:hypothetical protein
VLKSAAALLLPILAYGAVADTPKPPAPTKIDSRAALERLLGNSGMSIQWISWTSAERGRIKPTWQGKTLMLEGVQRAKDGPGRVSVVGHVTRIGATEFVLNGTITIEDTPDAGRRCEKAGDWKFAITQNRKYWRLRDFEWCDQLTDYIDIYF